MPKEMKDAKKGGEDRVKEMKKEQQEKMDKGNVKEAHEYPEAKGDTSKDVPAGT